MTQDRFHSVTSALRAATIDSQLSATSKSSTRKAKNTEDKSKISFVDKKKIAYENRIRAYSTPDKIFRYFGTVKLFDEDNPQGLICMTPDDFLRSISPGLKQPDGLQLDKFRRCHWHNLKKNLPCSDVDSNEQPSIFEQIGCEQFLITFTDFVFLVSLLSMGKRSVEIPFQMFDSNGNGTLDWHEFNTLKSFIRSQTSIGRRHRDHSTTGPKGREFESHRCHQM